MRRKWDMKKKNLCFEREESGISTLHTHQMFLRRAFCSFLFAK